MGYDRSVVSPSGRKRQTAKALELGFGTLFLSSFIPSNESFNAHFIPSTGLVDTLNDSSYKNKYNRSQHLLSVYYIPYIVFSLTF